MATEIYGRDESGPLRFTECSLCISWANVDNWQNVSHTFRGLTCVFHVCSLCISWLNVDTFVCIRKIFYGWTLHICIVFATHKMFECCTFVLYQCGFYFFALFFLRFVFYNFVDAVNYFFYCQTTFLAHHFNIGTCCNEFS